MEVLFAAEGDLLRIAEMTRALTIHHGAFEWTVESHLKHVSAGSQTEGTCIW